MAAGDPGKATGGPLPAGPENAASLAHAGSLAGLPEQAGVKRLAAIAPLLEERVPKEARDDGGNPRNALLKERMQNIMNRRKKRETKTDKTDRPAS